MRFEFSYYGLIPLALLSFIVSSIWRTLADKTKTPDEAYRSIEGNGGGVLFVMVLIGFLIAASIDGLLFGFRHLN